MQSRDVISLAFAGIPAFSTQKVNLIELFMLINYSCWVLHAEMYLIGFMINVNYVFLHVIKLPYLITGAFMVN